MVYFYHAVHKYLHTHLHKKSEPSVTKVTITDLTNNSIPCISFDIFRSVNRIHVKVSSIHHPKINVLPSNNS